MNFAKGKTTANAVLTALGTNGAVTIRNAVGSADVVSDLSGYFMDPRAVPVPLPGPPLP